MLSYSIDDNDEQKLFDKNNSAVGHALVSSEYNEIIEFTILVDDIDQIIEDVRFKVFGSKRFESLANFVAMSIVGFCAEDIQAINSDALAQDFGLEPNEIYYATTMERAVLKAISNYLGKLDES